MQRQRGGSIVCISSVSAQRGGGILGGPHYSAAKAGVLGLARAMARELGADGVRVNCITPGLIETDIQQGQAQRARRKAEIAETVPLGRLGVPPTSRAPASIWPATSRPTAPASRST